MKKRRSFLSAAGRRGLPLGGVLALAACSGIEADVLSLRPVPDLALAAPDAAAADAGAGTGCTTQTISTQSCIDPMTWLLKAQSVCRSQGLLFPGKLEPQDLCPLGSRGIRFVCCAPPPPPPTCTPRLQGDGMSCRDADSWLDSANVDCQARHEQVRMLALTEPCPPHGFLLVKYMCCTAPPSLPPFSPLPVTP